MSTTTSNLYPPILPDTLPAFVRTTNCRIYFSLSMYNAASDIQNVQISLINQNTNASALNPQLYPSGIKIAELSYDSNATGDYKYYVDINLPTSSTPSDLVGDSFEVNQFYIAQLRFTSINANAAPSQGTELDTWLYDNRDYFSEWSTMCLIKGIDQPYISINSLDATTATILSDPLTKIIGRLSYADGSNEREYLKSYNIAIYTGITLVFKTDEIYTNQYNPNQFNYELIYNLQRSVNYTLIFTYTTNNLYSQSIDYDFTISTESSSILDATVILTSEDDEGRIKIQVEFQSDNIWDGTYIISNGQIQSNDITVNPNTEYRIIGLTGGELNFYCESDSRPGFPPEQTIYSYFWNEQPPIGETPSTSHTFITPENCYRMTFKISNYGDTYHNDIFIYLETAYQALNQITYRNFIIKRSSSKSNFNIWESIKTFSHPSSQLKYIWYDTSIESGILYKYRIEEDTQSGTTKRTESDSIICLFEDIFITNGDKQLKIRFNPSVSEFKYNVTQSQQNTLGAKFPYVKRNGNNYFRTFNISGLIASFMDSDEEYNPNFYDGQFHDSTRAEPFTTPNEIYGNSKTAYIQYNNNHKISKYTDYIYEREFRQKVMDYLYDNTVKLFRSTTEGNILVKLMNISFQPTNELGRMLYSFSASAVEIADVNINNYKKYNIINKKDYSEEAS